MPKQLQKKEEIIERPLELEKEISPGVYANQLLVSHTQEEFVLDFFAVAPPRGAHVARVFTSPGHLKRIIRALQTNVQMFEKKYGKIKEAQEPQRDHVFDFKLD